jgi:hypothetical protein
VVGDGNLQGCVGLKVATEVWVQLRWRYVGDPLHAFCGGG